MTAFRQAKIEFCTNSLEFAIRSANIYMGVLRKNMVYGSTLLTTEDYMYVKHTLYFDFA